MAATAECPVCAVTNVAVTVIDPPAAKGLDTHCCVTSLSVASVCVSTFVQVNDGTEATVMSVVPLLLSNEKHRCSGLPATQVSVTGCVGCRPAWFSAGTIWSTEAGI